MTFLEYLKMKNIEFSPSDLPKLIIKYYEEYRAFVTSIKDGCKHDEALENSGETNENTS